MNKVVKTTLGVAMVAVTLGVTTVQGTVSAWNWGDNKGGRGTYTLSQLDSGALGDKVLMNSIHDENDGSLPLKDERNFVAARELGSNGVWQAGTLDVEEGKTYVVRMYVHNNNPDKDVVAKNVRTQFSLDQETAQELKINGFIDIDAANAYNGTAEYWNDVVFRSADGRKFRLDYVAGSALLENNYFTGGYKLSDEIVSSASGVRIGYGLNADGSLNGEIPGCFQYASYVTIRVTPVFEQEKKADNFTVEKKVRRVGETNWSTYLENLKVGDKVEYQIHYHNASEVESLNVMVLDQLPENMQYVAGTARLFKQMDGDPDYATVGKPLEDEVMTSGANIGGYKVNGDGYVRFTAEVVDKSLYCGTTKLRNWTKVTVGEAVARASADVYVDKTCAETTPETPKTGEVKEIPATGPVGIVGGAVGIGALTTAAGYYIRSRKMRG